MARYNIDTEYLEGNVWIGNNLQVNSKRELIQTLKKLIKNNDKIIRVEKSLKDEFVLYDYKNLL